MPEVVRTKLRELRRSRGLKVGEAANGIERLRLQRVGGECGRPIRAQWLANVESGHGDPSEERINLLAAFYGVEYKDLIPDEAGAA
jgi:transcriptional regulator with XRE-family HTH domain